MKKNVYLFVGILLAVVMALAGCTNTGADTATQNPTSAATPVKTAEATAAPPAEPEMVNGIYTSGLPIAPETLTVDVLVCNATHIGNYDEMLYWQKLEEITNIHFNFEDVKQGTAERVSLMFANRDYPDCIFRGASTQQILDAAAAGDIVALNDLLTGYCPNWSAIFEQYPYIKKVSTSTDGNIYSLPFVRMDESDSGVRDQWFINQTWLDSVGMEVPTTTDEFAAALKAFKENAGTGDIPADATPWHFVFNAVVGGQLDIYGCFGGFIGLGNDGIYWIDDEVQFGWTDDHNVAAVQYMHDLYADGLIPPEVFTDDWSAYVGKISSEPPVLGSFTSYNIYSPDNFVAMAPPAAEGVDTPKYRRQNNYATSGFMSIFSTSEKQEAIMRVMDVLAEPDWSIQMMYGMFDLNLVKNADGTIGFIDTDHNKLEDVPANFQPCAMTEDLMQKMIWGGTQGIRADNIANIYSKYTVPIEWVTPPLIFTLEQSDRMTEIRTDLFTYINDAYAGWIVDGGVEDDWDAFKEEVYTYGLTEYLEIYQTAYDSFNAD